MTTLIGRETELARAQALLEAAHSQRVLRALRIAGASGIGKTAFLTELERHAKEHGWLVLSATSHRIHNALPQFVARRLTRALADELGDRAERYLSGLNLEEQQSDAFEAAFFRALEGTSLDFPLLVIVDDAQWADEESLALLSRALHALADRPILLISAERLGERKLPVFDIRDESLALDDLSAPDALAVIRSAFPDASDEVRQAILERAGGRPVDLLALANAARETGASNARGVDAGMRATVARKLILLDADVREFLQVCSLIGEPISLTLLSHLWKHEELADLLTRTPAGFLLQEGGAVHFEHATISQSVRETIPIEIPFRRRILAAIQARTEPTVEDLEHIVEQAAACGDRELERATLMRIGDDAARAAQYGLAASAWSRASAILPPTGPEIIPFYARLSQMYNATNREVEAIAICRKALSDARNAGIRDGLGGVAGSLIVAYWHCGHYESAESELRESLATLTTAQDRANLLSVGAYISMMRADAERARKYIGDAHELGDLHPHIVLRIHVTDSFLKTRIGDRDGAVLALKHAREAAKSLPPIDATVPLAAEAVHEFSWYGPTAVDALLERRTGEETSDLRDVYRAAGFLARGEFDDLMAQTSEALVRRTSVLLRRILLAHQATGAALSNVSASDRRWDQIKSEVSSFAAHDRSSALVPIAEAWLIPLSTLDKEAARSLLRDVLKRRGEPLDVMVHSFPVLSALAARTLGDKDALEQLADQTHIYQDQHPWGRAQHLLAQGAASSFLKRSDGADFLRQAATLFGSLGSPGFAAVASRLLGDAPATNGRANQMMGTTRREREIAALIAEGLTNREIANKLVLSERTVEGHVANLFAKVNVSSRTQIAAWFLRATNSVAY